MRTCSLFPVPAFGGAGCGTVVEDGDISDDISEDAVEDVTGREEIWKAPVEEWSKCPDTEYIEEKTLAQKAEYYEWAGMKLHQKPWDASGHEDYSAVYKVVCDSPVPTEIVPDEQLSVCSDRHWNEEF